MLTRFLTAAAAAMVMTGFLIFVMNYLIEVSEAVESTPRPRMTLEFGRQVEERDVVIDKQPPVVRTPPTRTPPLTPPTEPNDGTEVIGVRMIPPGPPGYIHVPPVLGTANNALINIIAVQPNYPLIASQRGLEGHVIVVFDVTEMGTVSNVVIVESSSSVFNKAAIDAAYRFRYKARMIGGVPQATSGLRKLFTFEMEQS